MGPKLVDQSHFSFGEWPEVIYFGMEAYKRHVIFLMSPPKNLCTRAVAGDEVPAAVFWPVTLRAAKGREVTRGQNQGRDFCRDLVQPSQVVRGDAATLDATTGRHQPEPAGTDGPSQVGAEFADKGTNFHQLWQPASTSRRTFGV